MTNGRPLASGSTYRALGRAGRLWAVLPMILFAAAGCSRKSNALLSTPPAGVTALSLFIPQIDVKGADDRIFLSVLDGSLNPLTDFKLGDFSIVENGAPGIPSEVGRVNDPLSVMLVIDRSLSMTVGGREAAANTAASNFVDGLGAGDHAAIIEFNSKVEVTVDFTTDKSALKSVLVSGRSDGNTALYDATATGASHLNSRAGRRLLLVLTDGEDTASSRSIDEAILATNQEGLAVFPVGLGDGYDAAALNKMASETGGSAFFSSDGSDLTNVFLTVLNRFNNLVYVKYRRRSKGMLKVYLNCGSLTASASKPF
jgi:VWFA-related protein